MRLWLDTDIGTDVDDALTLAYVLRHPEIELVGVSTVFGDVALRTRMTHALLDCAGGSTVPVVTGLGVPITPGRSGRMFGHEGRGLLDDADPVIEVAEEPDADAKIDALAEALSSARADVVLAIGPLTNLGALAVAGVRLPPLAIMGGKIADVMLPGMIPQVPEWNWYCDPVAVQQVLDVPRAEPARVVPAEVTFSTALTDDDLARLPSGDALCRALVPLCDEWLRLQRDMMKSPHPRVALHDPLTAVTLVEPDMCRFETRRIRVDDRGASEVIDGAPNIEVATTVDNDALRAALMRTWLSA